MGKRSAKWEKKQKERREQRKADRAHTDQMSSEEDISGREEEEARRLARTRSFFDRMEARKMKREKEKREENGGNNPMPEPSCKQPRVWLDHTLTGVF